MDKLYKSIPFLIAVIGVFSCQQWIEIPVTNQYLNWLCQATILGIFLYMGYRCRKITEYRMPWQIVLYLVMVIVSAAYGVAMSEGYWDYKSLVNNLLVFLLGLSFFYFAQPSKVAVTLRVWFYFSAIVFWILLPFMQGECVGKFLMPISFLLLFASFFRRREMLLVVALAFIVLIVGSLGARSTVLRFLVCLLIGLAVWFRGLFPRFLLVGAVVAEFVLPFALLLLGFTGVWNVFQMGESSSLSGVEVQNSYDSGESENLGSDTRTFIYVEEIASAIKHNYVLHGRSISRGYDSDFFGMADDGLMGRGERPSCEVSILNVFNYFGVIGVLIYFILFSGAVISVFKHSNNKVLFFIALYIGYRWIWAFVEDFTRFDLNTICLWVALSMCYSPFFLKMNDVQFGRWTRSLIRL